MLTLSQIIKVWEDRALYEGPNISIPRDHCSQRYYQESYARLQQQMSREGYERRSVTVNVEEMNMHDPDKGL